MYMYKMYFIILQNRLCSCYAIKGRCGGSLYLHSFYNIGTYTVLDYNSYDHSRIGLSSAA